MINIVFNEAKHNRGTKLLALQAKKISPTKVLDISVPEQRTMDNPSNCAVIELSTFLVDM